MKVKGLDGKIYPLSCKEANVDDENRSYLHLEARDIIKKVFPLDSVLEEITLPGCNNMRADFIILLKRIIFEVQGLQHFKYTRHFHKNLQDAYEGTVRDKRKQKWASLNKFFLVPLDCRKTKDWEKCVREYYKYEPRDID